MYLNNEFKYYLIFLFVLSSCNTSKKLYSQYCMNIGGPDNTVLWFNDDNSFRGLSYSDVAGNFYVAGEWIKSNDTILLRFVTPSIVDSITTTPNNNVNKETIITITDIENNKPIEGVVLFANERRYTTSEKGVAVIETININSKFLNFEYMDVKDSVEVNLVKGDSATISFDFRKLQSFQVSGKWIIKNKKLIPLERGYSIFRRCK